MNKQQAIQQLITLSKTDKSHLPVMRSAAFIWNALGEDAGTDAYESAVKDLIAAGLQVDEEEVMNELYYMGCKNANPDNASERTSKADLSMKKFAALTLVLMASNTKSQ